MKSSFLPDSWPIAESADHRPLPAFWPFIDQQMLETHSDHHRNNADRADRDFSREIRGLNGHIQRGGGIVSKFLSLSIGICGQNLGQL